jgi:hypothetical protein
MRARVSMLLSLAAIASAYAGEPFAKPRKVTITDVPSERRDYGIKIGNIKVLFFDGHSETWTSGGKCMIPHISRKGYVGWTRYTDRNDHQEPVNYLLRIRLLNGRVKDFPCFSQGPFIEAWGFADHDSAVVIQSEGRHGPDYYIKYDIATQRVLGTVEVSTPYNELPDWAKPYESPYGAGINDDHSSP